MVYAPVAILLGVLGGGLVWIWVSFCVVFMGARLVALLHRERTDHWLVTGVAPRSS